MKWTNKHTLPDRVAKEFQQLPSSKQHYISKDGQIWSVKYKRLLNPSKHKVSGVLQLDINGQKRTVHQLVLETYIGVCPENMECRHLDGNPQNNNLSNLRWGTRSENQIDSVKHGTHGGMKLPRRDIKQIKSLVCKGIKQKDVANQYNISQAMVSLITNNKRRNYDMD